MKRPPERTRTRTRSRSRSRSRTCSRMEQARLFQSKLTLLGQMQGRGAPVGHTRFANGERPALQLVQPRNEIRFPDAQCRAHFALPDAGVFLASALPCRREGSGYDT